MRAPTWIACAMFSASTGAAVIPEPGVLDARIRTVRYDPAQVYALHASVGYHIELELEPGEMFSGHGGGDLEGVSIAAHANHVILKPRAADVDTNLLILSDRRVYRFHYVVSTQPPSVEKQMFAVRFVYPFDEEASAPTGMADALDRPAEVRARNEDYWFCGHKTLKPTAASDDGVQTRLAFSPQSELPAIFVLNDDGTESLLNFSVNGTDITVHRIARRFVLRRGRLTGCVVNKAYEGSGLSLDSGTIAPEVVRDHRGPRT